MSLFFDQKCLLFLQIGNALLEAFDDRAIGQGHHLVDSFAYLLLDLIDFLLASRECFSCLQTPCFPDIFKHVCGQRDQAFCRLHGLQNVTHLTFDLIARNRFTVHVTAARLAQVIRVFLVLPLAPRRTQRGLAAGAGNYAPESEVITDIGTFGRVGSLATTRLDLLKGFQGHQWFVIALEPVNSVSRGANVSRVDRVCQDLHYLVLLDLAVLVARKVRKAPHEARYLRLRRKAT